MNGNVPTSNEAPSIEVVRDFWTKIVGTVGKVNKDDPGVKEWLKETNKRVGRTSSEGPDSIDETKLRKALKKAKSWSAPWDGWHPHFLVESTPLCTVCLGRCTMEGGERRSVSPRLAYKGSHSTHPQKG